VVENVERVNPKQLQADEMLADAFRGSRLARHARLVSTTFAAAAVFPRLRISLARNGAIDSGIAVAVVVV